MIKIIYNKNYDKLLSSCLKIRFQFLQRKARIARPLSILATQRNPAFWKSGKVYKIFAKLFECLRRVILCHRE